MNSPPFSDIADRQVGISTGVRRPKQTQTGMELSASSPLQPRLVLVPFDSMGMSIAPVLTQAPSSSAVTAVTMAAMVGASSLSYQGIEPPLKKAHFGTFVQVPSQYV
jgi:hypothetical protein